MSDRSAYWEGHLTVINWKGFSKSKSFDWNRDHMPVCIYCKDKYGTSKWNDDINIERNNSLLNKPIEATKDGKRVYICPSCYIQHHPVRYK